MLSVMWDKVIVLLEQACLSVKLCHKAFVMHTKTKKSHTPAKLAVQCLLLMS